MTIPPARQCNLPRCEREAVDPLRDGALCEPHLDGDEDVEPVTKTDESPDSDGDRDVSDSNDPESDTSTSTTRRDVKFAHPDSGSWPPELLECEQWMGHVDKKPFAPWSDRDHPDADPDEDGRWKWALKVSRHRINLPPYRA